MGWKDRQPTREVRSDEVSVAGEAEYIEWAGTFRIEGERMIFADNAGRLRTIIGYATREIAAALGRARP